MRSKSPNHRIWFFINNAKEQGKDSIEFYRPVSKLADRKYSELCEELNSMGYYAKDMTNPNGSSLAGIISINNILKVQDEEMVSSHAVQLLKEAKKSLEG